MCYSFSAFSLCYAACWIFCIQNYELPSHDNTYLLFDVKHVTFPSRRHAQVDAFCAEHMPEEDGCADQLLPIVKERMAEDQPAR